MDAAGTYYKALAARDARFDGVFFVAVTSTRIYCRPICPARTPKPAHCRFFETPQQAEHAGFRPCLRCRPELAPGSAPVDDAQRIAQLIVQRLEAGTLGEAAGLEHVAGQFELSSRQVRRIVRHELGVPPIQLLLTRRLLLAKQLLTETTLDVTAIAFASGFGSLRRFNDAFSRRYGLAPTRLRRAAVDGRTPPAATATSVLQLAYRPPYDWDGILAFFRARALAGVEDVSEAAYARTVRLGTATGWIRVTRAHARNVLLLEFTHGLMPALPALLARVRALFDLDARPDAIARHLARDRRLAAAVRSRPGVRLPGAFTGFEAGLRAILGQQVSVRAATTIAARVAAAFGDRIDTPVPGLTHLSPLPARLAGASIDEVASLGIVRTRARALIELARAQASGPLCLDGDAHRHPAETMTALAQLPGVGRWTAEYIAMRALRWPDACPAGDVVLRHALGGVSATELERISQAWRPWRSYAVMHLWRMAAAAAPRRGTEQDT